MMGRVLLDKKLLKLVLPIMVILPILITSRSSAEEVRNINIKDLKESQIVIDFQGDQLEKYAAEELNRYIKNITGHEINIIDDDDLLKDKRYIFSIGTNKINSLFIQKGIIDLKKISNTAGFIIKSVEEDDRN